MALKVFKLPGGEGRLRKPYLMPTNAEVERVTTGLLALGVAEIEELARAAAIGQNLPVDRTARGVQADPTGARCCSARARGIAFDHAAKGCRRPGIQCIAVPPSTFQA